ncbi:MAG: outer membrane protein assembly factor BamD [Elusimicrobia bacterium]|nr:outer membrane protein assembly factor BamD [Elusimicrobiota bacterium]
MSVKNILKTCSVLLLLVPFWGCVATQQDMLQMQSQMDDLNNNLNNMQKNQADLALKIDRLSTDLNVFSENIKDLSTAMDRLSLRLDDLDAMFNKRVNAIGATIKKQQEEVETALLPAKLYNDAYNAFLNNNFDAAVTGFKAYLAKFPSGDMAESSYFHLGESLYLRERWQDAALNYATVLDKYPKSTRIPSARLKYALSILKFPEDKKLEALNYLESIVRDYPKSSEARTAKDYIAKLKSPGKESPRPQRRTLKK